MWQFEVLVLAPELPQPFVEDNPLSLRVSARCFDRSICGVRFAERNS